jgi:signal transduction histidine kinase
MTTKRKTESGSATSHRPARDARPFDLIRWFSVLGLAAITLVSIVTSFLLSQFLTNNMLERDGALTMEAVQTVAQIELATDFFVSRKYDEDNRNLREFFQYLTSLHDVLRANVYATDGTIIWSTDRTLIGTKYDRNPELDEALEGKLKIESGVVGDVDTSKPEHVNLGKPGDSFVENYVPIRNSQTGALIGVVELYRVPTELFATIRRGTLLIWLSGIAAGVFLYVVLFSIVRRADRLIWAQQRRLIEAETLAVVGELAGSIAHGLRNPLSSIRTSAELAADGPASDVKELASDITVEVDRLERMVRQLLAYSQAPTVALEDVDVDRVLRETVGNFSRDINRRNVVPSIQMKPDLPPVKADAALLEQLFNSLLANALDAMPQGGRLAISASAGAKDRTVEIAIEDTGVGIPADQMSEVFKPFRTTKPKGLGMGLALARRIVRRFGGTIAIDSEVGSGTTVKLSLRTAR